MQEPRKDLFDKKFHRDFSDVPFLECQTPGDIPEQNEKGSQVGSLLK